MADEKDIRGQVREARRSCKHKRDRIVKYCNAFQSLLEGDTQVNMLEEAYAALVQTYKDLNKS